MKIISYSLFGADKITPENKFEFMAYLRGFYFNARMNRLIYPAWVTNLHVDYFTYEKFKSFFDQLNVIYSVINEQPPLCNGMIWRTLPIWHDGVTHVLCRDTDSITTYREAQYVNQWLNSGYQIHGILDNPYHAGLMGGMVGFKIDFIKKAFQTFEAFVGDWDLSKRGSDQNLMNARITSNPNLSSQIMWSRGGLDKQEVLPGELPGVDRILWESNLTCRHIGSPGVVELEIMRFFKRFDNDPKWDEFEKQFPEIFYWA